MSGIYLPVGQTCKFTKVSYRRIQYWDSTNLVKPSRQVKNRRAYSFRDVVSLVVINRLRESSVSIQAIRPMLDKLNRKLDKLTFPLEQSVILMHKTLFVISQGNVEFSGADFVRIDCRSIKREMTRLLGSHLAASI